MATTDAAELARQATRTQVFTELEARRTALSQPEIEDAFSVNDIIGNCRNGCALAQGEARQGNVAHEQDAWYAVALSAIARIETLQVQLDAALTSGD